MDNDSDGLADEGCFPVRGVVEDPLSSGLTGMVAPKAGTVVYPLAPDFDPHVAYGIPIAFQRTFMSHYRPGTAAGYRNPFGNLWQHSFMSWLDKNTVPNPDTVIVHMTDGHEVLFTYSSTSGGYDTYVPQVGVNVKYLRQATTSPFKWELRMLSGRVYVYDWSSPTGKLIEIRDSLSTPNVTTISYDGSGRPQYVTDAQGTKRLKFSYNASSRLNKVEYQTISGGTATTRSFADYVYSNNQLLSYQPNSGIAQSYTYSGGELTLIEDDAGNDILSYTYQSGTNPEKVARLKSSYGELGFEYGSGRSACTGGTMVFFNRKGTTACDADSDCGTGLLCGGEVTPGTGNTGVCYRAARCLQLSSPSEDLVTTVAPVGPPSESCEGACTSVAQYDWFTSSVLDLKAIKDPANNYTSYVYNTQGLPTTIVYGDNDNDASNGGGTRTLYLFYNDTNFPGLVTERRRQSDLSTGTCSASVTTGCQRTIYGYTDGFLTSREEIGFTLNSSGTATSYDTTTSFTRDTKGRITEINGPLAGANDVTDFTFWSSSDVFKDGQLKEVKRKRDSTTFLVTTLDDYDYWSNAKSVQAPDGTYTCMTFHADRNYLTSIREAMNGQTSCATTNAADLVVNYTRDKTLRLTKIEYPAGGCTIREYDSLSRLVRIKDRDDCNAASSGDKQEFTYDDDGLLIKTELFDSSGTVTNRQEQTYFDSRRVATIINPVNTSKWTSITYNSRGFVDTVEAESSLSKTTYQFDADDRLSQVDHYRDASNSDTWTLVHDWLSDLISITDEDSKQIQDVRDDRGWKVKTVTPDSGSTLRLFNADGSIASVIEPDTQGGTMTHSYTSDNLQRTLTIDYASGGAFSIQNCQTGAVETTYVYDTLPGSGAGSCPTGMTCSRINGRLAYIKTSLLCDNSTDHSLDQETWYAYDDAGRMIREYIHDDNNRTADHQYTVTKNGDLAQVTLPSGAVMGWTYGSAGSNSDQSKIAAAWRTSTATPIVDSVTWFPFGPLKSYRHQNTISGNQLRTVISDNLAYRISDVRVEQTTGTLAFEAAITEDDKGRVTARHFSGGITGLTDSYFLYDKLDRLLCETDDFESTCPTAPNLHIKNSHDASPPYTASNDWKQFERPIPGFSKEEHDVTLGTGKDQISAIAQPCPAPGCQTQLGTTSYTYYPRGDRWIDDNQSSLNFDERSYTYDGRRNVRTVAGKYNTGCGSNCWHAYVVTSAYDARNRRVFKSFLDQTSSKEAQWFFYYDPQDRLTEIRATPDISDLNTYDVYQIAWIDTRAVLFWKTSYPGATTSRRYIHTDETSRPVEMYYWPSTGDATRAWATNPDAYGNDAVLTGSTVLQPFVHPGQYRDVETTSWQNNGTTVHRAGVINNWFRAYDPFIGSYLQVDPLVATTWDIYAYAGNDPVNNADPSGLAYNVGHCHAACPVWGGGYGCWENEDTGCWCTNSSACCGETAGGDCPGSGGNGSIGGGGAPETSTGDPTDGGDGGSGGAGGGCGTSSQQWDEETRCMDRCNDCMREMRDYVCPRFTSADDRYVCEADAALNMRGQCWHEECFLPECAASDAAVDSACGGLIVRNLRQYGLAYGNVPQAEIQPSSVSGVDLLPTTEAISPRR